jgi:phage tail sheath protein FI
MTVYPGVYVKELSSGAKAIPPVPTSRTAFVGSTLRGPVSAPILVRSFSEFQQTFGGLDSGCTLFDAVNAYYLNGGVDSIIVRVTHPDSAVATGEVGDPEIIGNREARTGIYSLESFEGGFNLLVIPPLVKGEAIVDIDPSTWRVAADYCVERRAFLIVDPPSNWDSLDKAEEGVEELSTALGQGRSNAASFFPRVQYATRANQVGPSAAIAGVIARTDLSRGVWKSPAGIDASLAGVTKLSVDLSDADNQRLNRVGINCLRYFHAFGNVVWGARTLEGSDHLASEWKYIAVRRLALLIEESVFRGTKWVVFEPNDEPLWAQIRLNVGAFMQSLFRQGAFQGGSPREAYFVKCDKETTTQADIDRGLMNFLLGFAPLNPAEFVVIKIQQIAGQIAS